jgi:hypothetical protein
VIFAITLARLRVQQQRDKCPIARPFVGALAEPPLAIAAPRLARPP